MSELYQLPDGWAWKRLVEVCKKITDGAHQSPKTIDKGKPYITVRDIQGNGQIDFDGCKFISNEDFELLVKNNCKPNNGDVLLSKDGTVGKVSLVKDNTAFVVLSSLAILSPSNNLLSEFLKNYLLSPYFVEAALNSKTGAAIKRIVLKAIKEFYIPVPPLEEQKRIVQKLDALFERIDKAIALLQKNINAADNFMNSVLNDVFSDLEQNHPSKDIKSFASVGTGVTPLKTNQTYYDNGTINWITSKSTGEPYVNKADELITALALNECRLTLNPVGTLIVALYGQGKTRGQVSELLIEAATNQAVATILVDGSKCINKYLKWYLKKSYLELREKSNGGTQQNLNLSIIKSTLVPLPEDLSIQQKIVAYLDEVSAQIEQMKSAQQQKMQNLLELKSSILDQAFHGKL